MTERCMYDGDGGGDDGGGGGGDGDGSGGDGDGGGGEYEGGGGEGEGGGSDGAGGGGKGRVPSMVCQIESTRFYPRSNLYVDVFHLRYR